MFYLDVKSVYSYFAAKLEAERHAEREAAKNEKK